MNGGTAVEYGMRYLGSLADLLGDLWAYFIVGFLVAGLIAEFVPRAAIIRHFGRNGALAILRATLAGTVASLCSCGAIPVAVTMRKQGASKAAALTFMLAAPWAGFMQVVLFYRFLGLAGTATVFGLALLVAFLTGLVLARLERRGLLEGGIEGVGNEGRGCLSGLRTGRERRMKAGLLRVGSALEEAWEAFRELWKYLAVGLLLAAGLKAFVPLPWVAKLLGADAVFNPVLTALPLAVVVELCSESFSIFAGQLHVMGATLAVVFVVTLVGVTTDVTELTVILGKFGKRSAVAYVLTATMLALAFALVLQSVAG